MRKPATLAALTLALTACGTTDRGPTLPEPTATPVTHYSDSELSTPPAPGVNDITFTVTVGTDSTAHWGDVDTGNVTEIPAGATWTETVKNVDATEHWSVNVVSDMTPDSYTSCTIKVDGQVVSEDVMEGEGASSWCEVGVLSF